MRGDVFRRARASLEPFGSAAALLTASMPRASSGEETHEPETPTISIRSGLAVIDIYGKIRILH